MVEELKEVLTDDGMALALRRLYHVRKLKELGGPQVIIDRAEEMLAEAESMVGDRMEIVERLYPLFKEQEERAADHLFKWESRCTDCEKWVPNEEKDYRSKIWCRLFVYDTRPYPKECNRFTPAD